MALEGSRTLHFFDLPDIVREKILGYLTFEELAHLRIRKLAKGNKRLKKKKSPPELAKSLGKCLDTSLLK
ncbi:hypothetical protein E2C01_055096 [Portunus trituberculatus]|uniref:F-box domain-containing protein n=1 Tax=Portunus trituberculatus TaxID=210409 RepID=A0A5B7GTT2_PORTR|nr:hypothetical protein [Portunus trituberculatus]